MEDIDNEVNISQVCFDICRLQIISGLKLAHFQSPHRELKIPAKKKLKKRLDSVKPTYIYHT